MDLNDTDLVMLAKAARASAAFDTLVRRHQGGLRAFLLRMTGDGPLADDLAQETFIKAYRGLAGFRGGASFRSWLFAIALRELAQDRRRSYAQARLKEETQIEDEAGDDISDGLSIDLQNALSTLSPEERSAALLCDAAGFSHAEAAAALSAPLGSVKTYITRARQKLRVALSPDDVDGDETTPIQSNASA